MNKAAAIKIRINCFPNIPEIARQYDMRPADLLAFHNQHCGLADLLALTLPKYVEYLHLPRANYTAWQERSLDKNWFSCPKLASTKDYGIIIKHLPKNLQINYSMRCKRRGLSVELSKGKTYVNDKAVDKMVEKLVEQADQALYPLELSLQQDGGIKAVVNAKEIVKRWNADVQVGLQDYYQSALADTIIKELHDTLLNSDQHISYFKRSLFYRLFFLSVYRTYPQFKLDAKFYLYFASIGRNIFYETKCTLSPEYTSTGKIILRIAGVEEETDFNKDCLKGSINLLYKFHRDSEEIFAISGEASAIAHGQVYTIVFNLFELINKAS